MKFATRLLGLNAVLFVVFGLGFVFAPHWLSEALVQSTPATPSASIDMRATYGGISVGLGLFVGLCAWRRDLIGGGVLASLLVLSTAAAARIVGMVADGGPNLFMYLLLVAELLFVVFFSVALKKINEEAG